MPEREVGIGTLELDPAAFPLSSALFSGLGRNNTKYSVWTFSLQDACCVLIISGFHFHGEAGIPEAEEILGVKNCSSFR